MSCDLAVWFGGVASVTLATLWRSSHGIWKLPGSSGQGVANFAEMDWAHLSCA